MADIHSDGTDRIARPTSRIGSYTKPFLIALGVLVVIAVFIWQVFAAGAIQTR